jgi:hypothetical protein
MQCWPSSCCCQIYLGGWRVRVQEMPLMGEVRIVVQTLVGVTLENVDGPDAAGGERGVVFLYFL